MKTNGGVLKPLLCNFKNLYNPEVDYNQNFLLFFLNLLSISVVIVRVYWSTSIGAQVRAPT